METYLSDTTTKFAIRNRFNGAVIFECDLSAEVAGMSYRFQLGFAVRKSIETGANLTRANLTRANLSDADLAGANLTRANLTRANLADANLSDANLAGADLMGANLTRANLSDADLTDANLSDANLTDANLSDANLTAIKQDFLAEVLRLPNELDALRAAIVEGRIDGSSYSGECACLAGTLAKAAGCTDYHGGDFMAASGVAFHASAYSPRERFFLVIQTGNTPENNSAAKIALEWTDEAIAIRDMIRATAPRAAP